MSSYRDLAAWQQARRFALEVGRAANRFPVSARIAVGDQLLRAAVSVLLNITEGNTRRGARDARRFFDIAASSLAEAETALDLARDLDYMSADQHTVLRGLARDTGKALWGLLRAVSAAAQ